MTPHPARYSDVLLPIMRQSLIDFVGKRATVLDPFAGTGRIHELSPMFDTTGIEIEPEWASMNARTQVGNALFLPFDNESFDAICTSPTYGNRMADHHEAKDGSKRITYRHRLGRALSPDNSGQLQWGPKYQAFHERAWTEAVRVLRPDGVFVLNISDHIRKGELVRVAHWHAAYLASLGLRRCRVEVVPTPRMRFGANADLRTGREFVITFKKTNPTPPPKETE